VNFVTILFFETMKLQETLKAVCKYALRVLHTMQNKRSPKNTTSDNNAYGYIYFLCIGIFLIIWKTLAESDRLDSLHIL
jgi:hypothetical protein